MRPARNGPDLLATGAVAARPAASGRSIDPLFGRFPTIGLAELVALADLQHRYDEKYLVHLDDLAHVLARLGAATRVLEVDAHRLTAYDTRYLDTAERRSYRDHVQGRRRRYKIRTRRYGEHGPAMLEVKLKGHRGSTIKHRRVRTGIAGAPLDEDERAFVADVLHASYGWSAPGGLASSARLRFQRATLVDVAAGERLTIDVGLTAEVDGRRVDFDPAQAIVEVKSPVLRGATRRRLLDGGLRPARISKYGLAIAAARADLPAAPWRPVLCRLAPTVTAGPGAHAALVGLPGSATAAGADLLA